MQMLMGLFTSTTATAATAAGTAATATGAAAAGATTAAAAGSAFSLSSLLQGTATILSMVSTSQAAEMDAQNQEMAAQDAQRQKPLEMLNGIQRRASIKREAADALGQMDIANAAGSTDLSFGTPTQARKDAFREQDLALSGENANTSTSLSRLTEQEVNYRKKASQIRKAGATEAFLTGIKGFTSMMGRG